MGDYDDEYDDPGREPRDDSPIGEMSEEEQAIAHALTPVQVEAIDSAILAEARSNWTKVATILTPIFLKDFRECVQKGFREGPGIPLAFLVKRVMCLVESGTLESQGNLRRIQQGKVRLPGPRAGKRSSLRS